MMLCPLCLYDASVLCDERPDPRHIKRRYWRCPACDLVFLDPSQRMSRAEEKARYDEHQNDPNDQRYVDFLNRLAIPLAKTLWPGSVGLDFGCGPGPTLSLILNGMGFFTENYDPFYAPQRALLEKQYDFVASSETIEHFHRPKDEFLLLDRLLKPGGRLGVMTEILTAGQDFSSWWYPRDPTHVSFYTHKTFAWVAAWLHWKVAHPRKNVVIFTKAY